MTDPFASWIVALTHTGFGAGLPLSGRDWWALLDPPPTSPSEIEFRLSRSSNPAVRAILDRKIQLEPELEAMEQEGIVALTMFDKKFPAAWADRLGPRVPPVVFCEGDLGLLQEPAIGIAGSREADEAGLAFTEAMARRIAERGDTLVTGGANGVDKTAVSAAVRAGGSAIVVCASPFDDVSSRFRQSEIDMSRVLLVTASHPKSAWSVGKAMGRNKLIYALSSLTVVTASQENTGGTWNGATEAIKMAYCPVCAWVGAGATPGNKALVGEGAIGITAPEEAFQSVSAPAKTSLFD